MERVKLLLVFTHIPKWPTSLSLRDCILQHSQVEQTALYMCISVRNSLLKKIKERLWH